MKSIVAIPSSRSLAHSISKPETKPTRRGVDFNPYLSAAPLCSIRVSSTVKSLFSLSLTISSPEKLRYPYPFPLLVTDLSIRNPRTFLISWTIQTYLPSKVVFYYSLSNGCTRHWLPSQWWDFVRELQLDVFPSPYSLTYRENREGIETRLYFCRVSPRIFRFNYLHPVGSDTDLW